MMLRVKWEVLGPEMMPDGNYYACVYLSIPGLDIAGLMLVKL